VPSVQGKRQILKREELKDEIGVSLDFLLRTDESVEPPGSITGIFREKSTEECKISFFHRKPPSGKSFSSS
jgi:hypothetical protein